jgi:hypothetical protein
MSRFRGTVEGGRGQASRLGHHYITTDTNGWNLGVNVDGGPSRDLDHPQIGIDRFTVYVTGGSHESSRRHRIAQVEEIVAEDGGIDRQVTVYDREGRILMKYTI